MKYLRLVALFGIIFSYSSVSSAQDWDVVQVLPPANGFGQVSLYDINDSGVIVGIACNTQSCAGPAPIIHQIGVSTFLDHPVQNTEVYGINNNNLAVGYSWDSGLSVTVAEKWEAGVRSHLGQYLNFSDSYAIDVNNSGIVIGRAFDRVSNQQAAWKWENGVFSQLPLPSEKDYCIPQSLNNSSFIVGECGVSSSGFATGYVWDSSLNIFTLNAPEAISDFFIHVYDINDNGQLVGELRERSTPGSSYKSHAAYWESYTAQAQYLKLISKDYSGNTVSISGYAGSINNHGNITGSISTARSGATNVRVAYWHNKDAPLVDLGTFIRAKNISSSFAYSRKINDCNQILLSHPTNRINSSEYVYLNPSGCVCGVNTQDANNNKIIDCMEPTAATKPPAPVIGVKGARVFVNVAVPPPGMGYKTVVQVYNSKNKRIGRKTTSGSQVEFKKLFGRTRKGQRHTVKANIYWTNGTITTQTSKRITKKFRVK